MTNEIQQEDPSYLSEEDRREERRIEKLKVPKLKPKKRLMQAPRRPPLEIAQILVWADSHHKRTGRWPTSESGAIFDAPGETWRAVQRALTDGRRGLQGSSSLAQLLFQRRGVNRETRKLPLTEIQILAWADAHYERTAKWPFITSGRITERPELTWKLVHYALLQGRRGLSGGRGLPELLVQERSARLHCALPLLTIDEILSWADAHHERTGRWPNKKTGAVIDAPGETWNGIQLAMLRGMRGLPAGKTLPMLLSERRDLRYRMALPRYTEAHILAWADAYFAREGGWPNPRSGDIPESPGDTWNSVQDALNRGLRGLPGGSSITRLLTAHRGVRNLLAQPKLTEAQILQWVDTHQKQTGNWPNRNDGAVIGAESENWFCIANALVQGHRGLPGGSSLARLLAKYRNVPNRKALPPYTEAQILVWADAFYARQGHWPRVLSGSIAEAPNETWIKVHEALERGIRGMPGGSSLLKFLQQHGRNLEMPASAGRPAREESRG